MPSPPACMDTVARTVQASTLPPSQTGGIGTRRVMSPLARSISRDAAPVHVRSASLGSPRVPVRGVSLGSPRISTPSVPIPRVTMMARHVPSKESSQFVSERLLQTSTRMPGRLIGRGMSTSSVDSGRSSVPTPTAKRQCDRNVKSASIVALSKNNESPLSPRTLPSGHAHRKSLPRTVGSHATQNFQSSLAIAIEDKHRAIHASKSRQIEAESACDLRPRGERVVQPYPSSLPSHHVSKASTLHIPSASMTSDSLQRTNTVHASSISSNSSLDATKTHQVQAYARMASLLADVEEVREQWKSKFLETEACNLDAREQQVELAEARDAWRSECTLLDERLAHAEEAASMLNQEFNQGALRATETIESVEKLFQQKLDKETAAANAWHSSHEALASRVTTLHAEVQCAASLVNIRTEQLKSMEVSVQDFVQQNSAESRAMQEAQEALHIAEKEAAENAGETAQLNNEVQEHRAFLFAARHEMSQCKANYSNEVSTCHEKSLDLETNLERARAEHAEAETAIAEADIADALYRRTVAKYLEEVEDVSRNTWISQERQARSDQEVKSEEFRCLREELSAKQRSIVNAEAQVAETSGFSMALQSAMHKTKLECRAEAERFEQVECHARTLKVKLEEEQRINAQRESEAAEQKLLAEEMQRAMKEMKVECQRGIERLEDAEALANQQMKSEKVHLREEFTAEQYLAADSEEQFVKEAREAEEMRNTAATIKMECETEIEGFKRAEMRTCAVRSQLSADLAEVHAENGLREAQHEEELAGVLQATERAISEEAQYREDVSEQLQALQDTALQCWRSSKENSHIQ